MAQRILVSSTVVNLAGEEENRPIYIRSTVLGGVLSNRVKSLGGHIGTSYVTGPGVNLKNFARWVRANRPNNYNSRVSFMSSGIGLNASDNFGTIAPQIPVVAPSTVEVITATIDQGLYTYWSEQWILENHPDKINTEWTTSYEPTTNTITVTLSGTVYTFVPSNNVQADMYLFVRYRTVTSNAANIYIQEPTVTLPIGQEFPPMTGWTMTSSNVTNDTASASRTSQTNSTFSDNSAPITGTVTTTYSTVNYQSFNKTYERVVTSNSANTNTITQVRETQNHNQYYGGFTNQQTVTQVDVDIGGGVTRTDTTTVNQQVFYVTRTTTRATQEIGKTVYSNTKLFIYKYGSGNSLLDNIIGSPQNSGRFFPFIPVRVDNQFPSATYLPDIFKASKTAFRRSTKTHLRKVTRKLAKHESLADIDYTFTVFGVSLNVLEMACREYIYIFFNQMKLQHGSQMQALAKWEADFDIAKASVEAYETWRSAQGNELDPLNGTNPPAIIPYPKLPEIKIRTYSSNPILGYDQTISWAAIEEESFTGVGRVGAKKDHGWLVNGPSITKTEKVPQEFWDGGTIIVDGKTHEITSTYIYYQFTATTYKRLKVYNLKHRNVVYQGHYVETTAAQALANPDESQFIIPLHEQMYKEMRLVRSTQMATACSFLLFNSYVVKKIRWYQTGFFRIILIIAAIVIAAYTGGTSLGSTAGILGTNGAVGAAIGLSGSYAAIAGAIINATASMIVFSVISNAAMSLLGPELGAILAAVAMIVLQNPNLLDSFGSSMTTGFSELLKADNIIKLTNAVGQGMTTANQALAIQTQENVARYNAEAAVVREQFNQQFGANGAGIDPRLLTQNTYSIKTFESVDAFLTRTLLTGSDIADMSTSMLSDFASITTQSLLM